MSVSNRGDKRGHKIKIKGKLVNIYFAEIVYKCEVCHSNLERHGMGLRCLAKNNHRGFVHRDAVNKVTKLQQENVIELQQFYKIENGKVELCQ